MPPDHRTFIRQRIVLMPENTGDGTKNEQSLTSKENLRYLAHIRYKIYLKYEFLYKKNIFF